MSKLSGLLKRNLKANGLTYLHVAEKLKVDPALAQRWVEGKSKFSLTELKALKKHGFIKWDIR